MRVLVVDDGMASADMVAAVLETHGHTTCVAYTAEEALQLALGFEPNVALLDLSGGARGIYELAEAFRTQPSLNRCRFVGLTGNTERTARRQGEAAGFHRHLTRPLNRDALFDAVEREDERPTCRRREGLSKPG